MLFSATTSPAAEPARGKKFMVATVHPLATDAAVDVFREGGNAVDAAIAAALTLGVVDNHNSGLGGGCFVLIRLADSRLVAIDGREMAPAAAHRDMYLREGKADTQLSQVGPLASGVPGALAAYVLGLRECGTKSLSELILPAARIAAEGFSIDSVYARKLESKQELLARYAGSRAALLKADGSAYLEGEVLRQPDLANSYRLIADQGPDWFYRGPFAEQVADWMAQHGGILTVDDFRNYQAKLRQPILSKFRNFTIVGFPPPSSGGIHVAQILNLLEHFPLGNQREQDPARATHLVVEAMKLAFADRAHWLGDADFAPVPRGLTDRQYASELANRIDPDHSTPVEKHGLPPNWQTNLFGKHTTHITTADAQGNWVAITATVNTTFGSKVIVPGTGIVLNNEMDDFSIRPGTPNAFGLLGAENNSVAPGKRPLSSMSPTIVLDASGRPVLTTGAAGGPKIITQVLQTILNHLEYGMDLQASVAAPRVHHQWRPDRVLYESDLPEKILDGLRQCGHELVEIQHMGVSQAIARTPGGTFIGVHDPRTPGKAAGE